MTVINLTIEESSEQLIAGFPRSISISANISSTIFYTLDGSTPTTSSIVYISPFDLPLDVLSLTLKVFATNGTDSSAIITKNYSTNIINNTRLPHSPGNDVNSAGSPSLFPFGSNTPDPNLQYENNAEAGTTVLNPSLPVIPYGFDGSGNPVGANQDLNDYLNVYSTTTYQNKVFPNVGNLPGKVTILGKETPIEYQPESSSRSSTLFNPKAMVIFQDTTTDDPSNPPQINGQYFSLGNEEIINDGSLYATSLDTPTVTGSFIKSHYNPRTQMITSYYRDAATNRWLISSAPYQPKGNDPGNLAGMVFGRGEGVGFVFQWHPFQYRTLI